MLEFFEGIEKMTLAGDEKEAFFEEMYANYPEKFNTDWEVFAKQEWLGTSLRCDVIYKSKSDGSLHLVEIKRHYADFPNISQVMEYYAELKSRGIKIDQVYILAKDFNEELREALKYCNIRPLKIDFEKVGKLKGMNDEEVEGIFKVPLKEINSVHGEFAKLPKDVSEQIKFQYESYKKTILKKPQSHYFEVWEFKIPRKGTRSSYILSIKHNGELINFNRTFDYMQGTSRSTNESTRNFAWEFFKKSYLNKSYKNLIIRSYDPNRAFNNLADDKRKIDDFLSAFVNPNIR